MTGTWRNALSFLAALLLLWLAAAGAVHAAVQSTTPAAIDPRSTRVSSDPTVDRDRTDRLAPALPSAKPAPALPGSSAVVETAPTPAPVIGVHFVGASLSKEMLKAGIDPWLGKPATPATLKGIADAVGATYAKSDIAYYAVVIPPQQIRGGRLVVQVTEGRVTRYTLNGVAEGPPTKRVGEQIKHIMADTPLRKSVLERAILLMRDLPGQTVDARIRQLDRNGALILDLTAKRKFADIAITIDNDGVANVTSAFQAQIAVGINNILRDGDRTRVSSYLPIHPKRYQYYSFSHTTPIGSQGMTAGISAAHLRTRSSDRMIKGEATLAGLSLAYPVIRSTKTNLSLTASLDGVNSTNYFLDTRFGDYRARAIRLGASWSKADDRDGYGVTTVISRGLDAFGARAFTGFSEKAFTKVNVNAIGVKGLTKTLSIKTSIRAQYSADKLPVTERIALGGPGAGRAFRAGSITAEKALAGMMELSWSLPGKAIKGSALFAYVDGGTARTVARPAYALPADSFSLASVGAGARVSIAGKWRASVELAVPVKRPNDNYRTKPRLFFGIGRTI